MVTPWGNKGVAWIKRWCKDQCQVQVCEEGHARPGWTTSRRGQDCPWKIQSEWQRTGTNGESTSMVWPTLGSRIAKEQNRKLEIPFLSHIASIVWHPACEHGFVSLRLFYCRLVIYGQADAMLPLLGKLRYSRWRTRWLPRPEIFFNRIYWQPLTLPLQYKKLSCRRGTARCVVSVEILPIPTQQCRNYFTTSPEQIEVMKLEGYSGAMCNKNVHSTMTRSSRFQCPIGVINKPTTDELWISPLYRRLAVAKLSKSAWPTRVQKLKSLVLAVAETLRGV